MSRNNVLIDLGKLGGRVFVGRSSGKKARKYFKLDECNEKVCKLVIKVPENTISINSSFFLGLFGPDVERIHSVELFFDYVDISRLGERFQDQLKTAVSRSLLNRGLTL
ncbi:hypothetical protein [Hahella chejuensis]|uniref:hypothetical protein n=1 Tax=Hahella chejuensis TaxID=158327 RepID=UPI0005A119B3|nr:hypothetical protein [Hahella chejuensis]